jgi:hypothetical protein
MKAFFFKKILLSGMLFCLVNTTIIAQSAPKLGEVSEAELKIESYDFALGASAVILMDYGNTYFNEIGQTVFVRYRKVKILNANAYELADVEIPTRRIDNSFKEVVNKVRGFTYNMAQGKMEKTELSKDAIFDEKITSYRRYKKFAMPNVKVGSIIEYQYEIVSDFIFSLRPWLFQDFYPILHSEYVTEIPERYEYIKNSQSFMPFTEYKTDRTTQYGKKVNTDQWIIKNIPAFKDEKYITSYRDCINTIEFQLSSVQYSYDRPRQSVTRSWAEITESLMTDEGYGGYVGGTSSIKKLVPTLIAGKTTNKEKMNVIYDYVKNNFTYNGSDDIFAELKLKDFLEEKAGGSAEINLTLVAMLREAGLNASPVLLSTRDNGKINLNYPLLNDFNYNIAHVVFGEEEYLLDATDVMQSAGMLPEQALSEIGLLVEEVGVFRWIGLLNRTQSTQIIYAKLELSPDGTLKGDISQTLKGYAALDVRKKMKDKAAAENDTKDISLAFEYENLTDYEKPLKGKIAYEATEYTQVSADRIYLNPMLLFKSDDNPFKSEERKYPVDFAYPSEVTFFMNFTLPSGYVIEEIPTSIRHAFEDKTVRFDYLVTNQVENLVQITCKVAIDRAVFQPEEYQDLKTIFAHIIAKQGEAIVLKKQ